MEEEKMKMKTTMKAIKQTGAPVIKIGYGQAQYLLKQYEPTYYTQGVYGWNADVYSYPKTRTQRIYIVTGYRPFGNIEPSYNLVRKYDQKARVAKWQDRAEILEDFINACLAEAR